MKTIRRLLGLSAAIAMACTSVPASAFEEEKYDLYVNGSQFTSVNLSIACGEGTAVFDGKDTLTLTDAFLDEPSGSPEGSFLYGVINSGLPDLKIVLVGENVIDGRNNVNDGIDSAGSCNVTITGPGSLEINDAYYGTYIGYWEDPGADLTITGGASVKVTEPSCAGIWVNHDITFDGCKAEIIKSDEGRYNGIVSNVGGTVTFTDSEVEVKTYCAALDLGNGDDTEHAIVVNSGTVTLESRSLPTDPDDRYNGVAVSCEPDGGSKETKCTLTVNGGILNIKAEGKCVDLPADKIILGDGVTYIKGTSLTDGGNVIVGIDEEPAFPGDVDGNNRLNMKDLATLQRYVNGWDVKINEKNADLTGDKKINMKDVAELQKLLNSLPA